MVTDRKSRAIELRKSGRSIKSISTELGAAQSSVSIWVRDVKLTKQQLLALRANTHSPETIERRRQSRLASELSKRNEIIENAKKEIKSISKRELWLIGAALYWAEGGKTKSIVRFSNGDPRMIQIMMRYFTDICGVDKSKIRGHIHIHENLNTARAELYWQKVTDLPSTQFYKTYNKPNRSSKSKRNSLPYGVCDIYILDYRLFLKIRGWTESIYEKTI